MSYDVVFLKRAKKDLAATIEWYEEKQEGLGLRFLQTIYAHINKIVLNPNFFSERKRNYKEAKVTSFPFVIVYKVYKTKSEYQL